MKPLLAKELYRTFLKEWIRKEVLVENMGKAIQITDEAYRELVEGRQTAIGRAKERGDLDAAKMFEAMGVGSFAGYLIYKELAKLEKDTGTHIIK